MLSPLLVHSRPEHLCEEPCHLFQTFPLSHMEVFFKINLLCDHRP